MSDNWKPANWNTVTPYLVVDDALAAIAFVQEVFDADLTMRLDMPDGSLAHAELRISDGAIMIGQAGGEWKSLTAMVCVYVPDVDATVAKALKAGGTEIKPVTDEFYGDRVGMVKDTNGISWSIHTHKETLTEDQIKERMIKAYG